MASTITFTLQNNQANDLNVMVEDKNTGQQVGTYMLNKEESVPVQIVADSWGVGKAAWAFWTANGLVTSQKQQDNIKDGDVCTLA